MNQNIDKFNRLYNSENKEQSDESEDEEYISCNGCSSIQNLKEKVSAACTCGKICLSVVPLEEIQNSILSSNELSREERDMFIMGKLSCVGDGSSTQRGKERKRRRYAYYFKNREICRGSFLFVYGVGSKYVKNIVSHLNENGFVPRIHKNKNRRPGNAFNFEDLKNAVNFIQNYADEFGLPQPNVKNHGNPSVFLPSAGNKTLLHSTYVTSCRETENRHVGLTTFKLLWKDCCPHIKYMSPRSDICPKCENYRANISTAAGLQEKQEHLQAFTEHLSLVEKERQVKIWIKKLLSFICEIDVYYVNIYHLLQIYNDAVKHAREEMETNERPQGLVPPCSTDLRNVHYTFDFAQALAVPHHARQEGPLYFLTPRKVQLFGVAIEGQYKQLNYVVDEDQGIGENGAGIKGANGVISMLHHCLTTYGSGEKACVIHCDNCAGKTNVTLYCINDMPILINHCTLV